MRFVRKFVATADMILCRIEQRWIDGTTLFLAGVLLGVLIALAAGLIH